MGRNTNPTSPVPVTLACLSSRKFFSLSRWAHAGTEGTQGYGPPGPLALLTSSGKTQTVSFILHSLSFLPQNSRLVRFSFDFHSESQNWQGRGCTGPQPSPANTGERST